MWMWGIRDARKVPPCLGYWTSLRDEHGRDEETHIRERVLCIYLVPIALHAIFYPS